MRENKKQAALDYIKSIHMEYDSDPVIAYCAFGAGAEWMQKKMIEKVCDWLQCMALDYMQGDITDVKWGSMFADLRKYVENGDD